MKKEIFLIIFGVLVLSSCIFFLFANNGDVLTKTYSGEEYSDATAFVSPDLDENTILAQNMDFEKQNGETTMTFKSENYAYDSTSNRFKENSKLKVGDNSFSGIISREDTNMKSFVKVDEEGNLLDAELHVNYQKSTVLNINGKDVHAPKGSTVFYKDGELKIVVPEGEQVSVDKMEGNTDKITYQGNDFNIKNADGSILRFNKGTVVHFDGQNYFLEKGDKIKYNGVSFNPKADKVNLYFDNKVHEGPSLSLGDRGFSLACADNPDIGEIKLDGKSDYYRLRTVKGAVIQNKMYVESELQGNRMGMFDRNLTASLTEPDSSMSFFTKPNGLDANIPTVECKGGYNIKTGKVNLLNKDGRTRYIRNAEKGIHSREIMVVDTTNDKYNKLIQLGPNSNMRMGVLDKNEDWENSESFVSTGDKKKMNAVNIYMLDANPELFGLYEFGSNNLKSEFLTMVDYTADVQKELNAKMVSNYPELKTFFDKYSGTTSMFELDNALNEVAGKDYHLSMADRNAIIKKYPDYWKYTEALKDMTIYYETTGKEEGSHNGVMEFLSSKDQKWGLRNALFGRIINSDEYKAEYNKALDKTLVRFPGTETISGAGTVTYGK